MTTAVLPTLARALYLDIHKHIEAEAHRTGEYHGDPTATPGGTGYCIPYVVAEQIIEKYLTEVLGDTPCEPYYRPT